MESGESSSYWMCCRCVWTCFNHSHFVHQPQDTSDIQSVQSRGSKLPVHGRFVWRRLVCQSQSSDNESARIVHTKSGYAWFETWYVYCCLWRWWNPRIKEDKFSSSLFHRAAALKISHHAGSATLGFQILDFIACTATPRCNLGWNWTWKAAVKLGGTYWDNFKADWWGKSCLARCSLPRAKNDFFTTCIQQSQLGWWLVTPSPDPFLAVEADQGKMGDDGLEALCEKRGHDFAAFFVFFTSNLISPLRHWSFRKNKKHFFFLWWSTTCKLITHYKCRVFHFGFEMLVNSINFQELPCVSTCMFVRKILGARCKTSLFGPLCFCCISDWNSHNFGEQTLLMITWLLRPCQPCGTSETMIMRHWYVNVAAGCDGCGTCSLPNQLWSQTCGTDGLPTPYGGKLLILLIRNQRVTMNRSHQDDHNSTCIKCWRTMSRHGEVSERFFPTQSRLEKSIWALWRSNWIPLKMMCPGQKMRRQTGHVFETWRLQSLLQVHILSMFERLGAC